MTADPVGNGQILAIHRKGQASADHQTNDRLLLDGVLSGLEASGYEIRAIEEDAIVDVLAEGRPDRVVSMAQLPKNTAHLAQLAPDGIPVINSFASVLATYRSFLAAAMAKRPDIPFAATSIFTAIDAASFDGAEATAFENLHTRFRGAFWVKRGDVHATGERDVQLIESSPAFVEAVASMRERGIETMIAQQHYPGPVLKFYAISERRFFHLQELTTGTVMNDPSGRIEQIATDLADFLGLTIFGGDVVMLPDGPVVIDVNAWPSFSSVRDIAAPLIAEAIAEEFAAGGA